MKHIVGFSGGAASSVVADIVAKKYPDTTILLFHDTKTEPKDNDRFRKDISNYINIPITNDSDGRNIWQVFKDCGYLGNGRNTMCSRILKQERSLKFLKANPESILYIGFTIDEWRRAQRTFARYQKHGIKVCFPLIDEKITKDECTHKIKDCWGIKLPKMYKWAQHANCIPCVKGKKAYWGLIYMFERKAWDRAVQAEKEHNATIFTEAGGLEEELHNCLRLAEKYLRKKTAESDQLSLIEYPCECAV
jgi:3'-phosphoadenosine 5'-phosphosulfate sulfotransferase (PAPS reductase)/FAD synthetase